MPRAYVKPACRLLTLSEFQMPVLAQTGQATTFNESQTLGYVDDGNPCEPQGALVFNFNLGGVSPSGDGTLTVSATGDLNLPAEFYTIAFEGVGDLSPTVGNTGGTECGPEAAATYNITLAQLENASGDGVIQVTATPSAPHVDCLCDVPAGESPSQVTVVLQFPGTS